MQVPVFFTVAQLVKILGPKLMRKYKALYKNLKKQNKHEGMNEKEYLNKRARIQLKQNKNEEKKVVRGPKQRKEYKGKTDPEEKKAAPPSTKNVEQSVKEGFKKREKAKDLEKMSTQQLRMLNEKMIRKSIREAKKKKDKP